MSKQNVFAAAIQAKLDTYAQKMEGNPLVMSSANGFYYNFQGGVNGYWNPNALRQIDSLVTTDSSTGLLVFRPSSFSQTYAKILENTAYTLSSEDQASINKDQQNASAEINAVIQNWEASFGKIDDAQMKSAVPPSKLGYIEKQVQDRWAGDINKAPRSLNSFKVAYQVYQVKAAESYTILSRSAAAMTELQAALGNAQTPTAANAGAQTDAKDFAVAYTVPAQIDINSGLQTETEKLAISISVESFHEREVQGKIDGSTEFLVPVLDLFSVNVEGSVSYDWSSVVSSSSTMKMYVVFPGVTVVGMVPMDLVGSKGWYDEQLLREIVDKTGKSETGFQLKGTEFRVRDTFGPGKQFARLKSALISQAPTVSITFTKANAKAIASAFKENTKVSFDLFGFIPLGSTSQSYEVNTVDTQSDEQTITITFGPTDIQGTVPDNELSACLIAGVPDYPPPPKKARIEANLLTGGKPYYQCFKTRDRDVYCSSTRFRSHAEAAVWVGQCMAHFGITASDLLGKPYESDRQPRGATIW